MLLQRENNMSPHKICVALMIMLMALSFTVNAEEAEDEETRTGGHSTYRNLQH